MRLIIVNNKNVWFSSQIEPLLLRVLESEVLELRKYTICNFFLPAKPELEFDNKFRDVITLNTGTSLRIPVTYKGLPKPTITWGKDEKPLKAGGSVTLDTKDTLTTLQVKKVTRADDGLYFITAENEAGKAKATFDVEVIGKDYIFLI